MAAVMTICPHCHQRISAPTVRETDVLNSLSRGYSNVEIGTDLGIHPATVKVHMKSLMRRAGVANRTKLLLWAYKEGWVDLPKMRATS